MPAGRLSSSVTPVCVPAPSVLLRIRVSFAVSPTAASVVGVNCLLNPRLAGTAVMLAFTSGLLRTCSAVVTAPGGSVLVTVPLALAGAPTSTTSSQLLPNSCPRSGIGMKPPVSWTPAPPFRSTLPPQLLLTTLCASKANGAVGNTSSNVMPVSAVAPGLRSSRMVISEVVCPE